MEPGRRQRNGEGEFTESARPGRQLHDQAGSAAGPGVGRDKHAAVPYGDVARDGEPESSPAVLAVAGLIDPGEPFEDPLAVTLAKISTGARVKARWADERIGCMNPAALSEAKMGNGVTSMAM